MRIPIRPEEITTVLPDHRDLEGAPEFIYRYPTPEDEADILMESVSAIVADPSVAQELQGMTKEERAKRVDELLTSGRLSVDTKYGRYLCRLFDQFILRVPGLELGEPPEPFDRQKHLKDIPGAWKMAIGKEIQERLKNAMTEIEEGNSSSPSSSAVTTAVTDSAAAEDDAS